MAATYTPGTHTAPETSKAGSVSIEGLSPGRTFTAVNDQWAPTTIFLPTLISSDGYPTGMFPVATGTGVVT